MVFNIEKVKNYIHEDLIDKYDWGVISNSIEYDKTRDCYIVSSADWKFLFTEKGELLQHELKVGGELVDITVEEIEE